MSKVKIYLFNPISIDRYLKLLKPDSYVLDAGCGLEVGVLLL